MMIQISLAPRRGQERELADRFFFEMRDGEPPEGYLYEWADLVGGGRADFTDKARADVFLDWLVSLDGWTETYCPVRVRYYP